MSVGQTVSLALIFAGCSGTPTATANLSPSLASTTTDRASPTTALAPTPSASGEPSITPASADLETTLAQWVTGEVRFGLLHGQLGLSRFYDFSGGDDLVYDGVLLGATTIDESVVVFVGMESRSQQSQFYVAFRVPSTYLTVQETRLRRYMDVDWDESAMQRSTGAEFIEHVRDGSYTQKLVKFVVPRNDLSTHFQALYPELQPIIQANKAAASELFGFCWAAHTECPEQFTIPPFVNSVPSDPDSLPMFYKIWVYLGD